MKLSLSNNGQYSFWSQTRILWKRKTIRFHNNVHSNNGPKLHALGIEASCSEKKLIRGLTFKKNYHEQIWLPLPKQKFEPID